MIFGYCFGCISDISAVCCCPGILFLIPLPFALPSIIQCKSGKENVSFFSSELVKARSFNSVTLYSAPCLISPPQKELCFANFKYKLFLGNTFFFSHGKPGTSCLMKWFFKASSSHRSKFFSPIFSIIITQQIVSQHVVQSCMNLGGIQRHLLPLFVSFLVLSYFFLSQDHDSS